MALSTAPTVIPERVAFIADDLLAGADSLWFRDHSYDPDDDHGDDDPEWEPELVHLGLMDDPAAASNNCYIASSVALDAIYDIDPDTSPGLANLSFATDEGASPVHYANTVTDPDTDQMWVIDFTARQYDPDVAFPLVVPVEEWHARISGYATARGWAVESFAHEDC